jgi:hypothetical protein
VPHCYADAYNTKENNQNYYGIETGLSFKNLRVFNTLKILPLQSQYMKRLRIGNDCGAGRRTRRREQ